MIEFALSILALVVAGMAIELFTSARTRGYRAERGIALGTDRRESAEDSQVGNPS